MSEFKTILIVANSGRMLAQFTKNAGFLPIVVDCFCDDDTRKLALDVIKVESLALEHLVRAFTDLNKTHAITHAIYGSGFELYVNSLEYLHQHYIVLGNTSSVFTFVQDKVNFFSILKELHLPYPQVSFQAPQQTDDWLVKPMQGEGGRGIRTYKREYSVSESCYWQKRIDGIAMSVVFVADESQFIIHGFHRQLTESIGRNEFMFSGIISQPYINEEITQVVNLWVAKIVSAFSLKGMNSLDFMVKNKQCYLLEINPRPSASMQLYNANLLAEHIKCFSGEMLGFLVRHYSYQAYKIVFAESEREVKEGMQWPKWAVDLPVTGSIIHTGMPICSIIAGGKNEQYVEDNLLLKQQIIYNLLR